MMPRAGRPGPHPGGCLHGRFRVYRQEPGVAAASGGWHSPDKVRQTASAHPPGIFLTGNGADARYGAFRPGLSIEDLRIMELK